MEASGPARHAASPPVSGAANERLRYIIDSVVAFVGALTPDGILTDANALALQSANLSRDDVIGKPFWDTHWWSHDPAVQDRLRRAITTAAGGEFVGYETEIRVAGDARRIIYFQITPHFGPDGAVDELILSGVDITDSKLAEESARAARDTFEALVTNSPFGIYVVDADFRLSLIAKGARKAFENVAQPIGRDFDEVLRILWPEPFVSEALGRFRHTLATGDAYHSPRTVETRHDIGALESYDWKIERITLPDGRFGVVCYFYDLSEREHYEAALRQSEARFRATFENAAVGIAHTARDGRWLRVNHKLCEIVGYSAEEIEHLTFPDITYSQDIEISQQHLARLASGEIDDFQLEKRYVRKDGSLVWVKKTVGAVRADDGGLDYFIAVIEDISAQKEAQARQTLLVNELNHRVKNTLATIQAMASHTLRHADDPQKFRDAFSGRLRAIASAHDSIFQSGQGSADLAVLIASQLGVFGADDTGRVSISGDRVILGANRAHALGLIVHELSTNAAKYGALSDSSGRIDITLKETPDGNIVFDWRESGGPPVKPPARVGFGSRLIKNTVENMMQGKAQLEYKPEGLRLSLTFAKGERG